MVGESLGHYEVLGTLGSGGRCQVNSSAAEIWATGGVEFFRTMQLQPRSRPQRPDHEAAGSCVIAIDACRG